MFLISLLVVPLLCLTKWDGKTTWFGNFKYGRGDTHYKAPSKGEYWKQVRFLCIRNPVSNFSKRIISVKATRKWVWLYDYRFCLYGWKNISPDNGNLRTFVFRPRLGK